MKLILKMSDNVNKCAILKTQQQEDYIIMRNWKVNCDITKVILIRKNQSNWKTLYNF